MDKRRSFLRYRLCLIGGLLALELIAIVLTFQLMITFECDASGARNTCLLLRSMVARAITIFAALGLIGWARPRKLEFLLGFGLDLPRAAPWIGLHFAGLALIFLPSGLILGFGAHDLDFIWLLIPWVSGAVAAALGAIFWLAPIAAWRNWLTDEHFIAPAILALAFFIPELAGFIQKIWQIETLTRETFTGVIWVLDLMGQRADMEPQTYVIGLDNFYVHIANACSGVEGFALVLVFTLLYAFLFRKETRFPHFWLLLPLGLLISWFFNILRIAGLIWIGAKISPDLAVNGFHSYAGWFFFTLLALGLLLLAHNLPWLQARPGRRNPLPLREDRIAGCILPFVFFMLASVIVSTFFATPDLGYPIKVIAMGAALLYFARTYRHLVFIPDPLALLAGFAIGAMWIALLPMHETGLTSLDLALAGLAPLSLALWAALRVAGTVVLVPLVEELFFRGYVFTRLDKGDTRSRWIALAISTALFAALHGRWLAAGIAGLVFGLLMMRRGRLEDAITGHMVANLIVALWALWQGDWDAI